jgi:hypothetical protein
MHGRKQYLLDPRWFSWHDRVKSSLRQSTRLLTVVGALSVLVTYIVKDQWQDQMREAAETIDRTETDFLIRRNIARAETSIIDVQRSVNHTSSNFLENRLSAYDEGSLIGGSDLHVIDQEIADVKDQLDSCENLMMLLPGDLVQASSLNNIRNELKGLAGKSKRIMDLLGAEGNDKQRLLYIRHAGVEAYAAGLHIQYALGRVYGELYQVAQDAKAKRQHRYDIVRMLSYAVYVLGWALALTAHLYGTAGIESES